MGAGSDVAHVLEELGIDPDPHYCAACGARLHVEHWPREHLRCRTHGTVGIGIHHLRSVRFGPHCTCWMHAPHREEF